VGCLKLATYLQKDRLIGRITPQKIKAPDLNYLGSNTGAFLRHFTLNNFSVLFFVTGFIFPKWSKIL